MVGHRCRLDWLVTLSVGAATDSLVGLATTAVNGVTVSGKPVGVSDGWPPQPEPGMLVIGVDSPSGAAEIPVQRDWSPIGDRHIDEDYTIPCYIDVRVPGAVQKVARDAAEAIFNAFWTQVVANPTLGGALQGTGYSALFANVRCTAANLGTVAESGRRCLITFDVHCMNLTR